MMPNLRSDGAECATEMEHRMKRESYSERLELRLPPKWDRELSAEAARAVTTKSEIARQAIIARLRKSISGPHRETV